MANHKTKDQMTPAEYKRACANAANARAAARAQAEARKASVKAIVTRAARTITRAERVQRDLEAETRRLPVVGALPDHYLLACVAEASRRADAILTQTRTALSTAEARAAALRAAVSPRKIAEPEGPQFAGVNGDGSATHDTAH